jgi:hypothetical protein
MSHDADFLAGRNEALIPFECKTSSLESEDGAVTVPTGIGIGYRSQLSGKTYLSESVMLF